MQVGPSEIINQPSQESSPKPIDSSASTSSELNSEPTATTKDPVAIERLLNRLQSGDSLLPSALLIGGVLLAIVIMMRMVRKNHKSNAKRSNRQLSPGDRITSIHTHAQATMDPAHRLMVETEEMARRLGATLDNKAARLELLIEEADRKLAILNRSIANPSSISPPPLDQPVDQPINQQPTSSPLPQHPARTIDPSLLDRARMDQDLEERQTRVAGRIEPSEQQPEPIREPEPKSIQSQIIGLAESGLSASEIARQLDQPIGQVELILNLRKQQG